MEKSATFPLVIQEPLGQGVHLILHRPQALNSLNLDLIRALRQAVDKALADARCRFVVLSGAGGRAFCAGGDIKVLADHVKNNDLCGVDELLHAEYDLDLALHGMKKPLMVLAHGITMGGGLGLTAGADLVVATGQTVMAMPETKIGFFPDVGASCWMWRKCPPGYPLYLALTGNVVQGPESVRAGLTHGIMESKNIPALLENLAGLPTRSLATDDEVLQAIQDTTQSFCTPVEREEEFSRWLFGLFENKATVPEIIRALEQDKQDPKQARTILKQLARRSPSALCMTLALFLENRGKSLETAFDNERAAALALTRMPDFAEGVRARLRDKDTPARWNPLDISQVKLPEKIFLPPGFCRSQEDEG